LNRSHEPLNRSNEALNRGNEPLHRSNEALNQDNEPLHRSNEALNQDNEPLHRSNEALNQDNEALNRSNEALNQDNEPLHRSNEALNRAHQAAIADDRVGGRGWIPGRWRVAARVEEGRMSLGHTLLTDVGGQPSGGPQLLRMSQILGLLTDG
jgi:exonuclease VII small subunit